MESQFPVAANSDGLVFGGSDPPRAVERRGPNLPRLLQAGQAQGRQDRLNACGRIALLNQ